MQEHASNFEKSANGFDLMTTALLYIPPTLIKDAFGQNIMTELMLSEDFVIISKANLQELMYLQDQISLSILEFL